MICNINYVARALEPVNHLPFQQLTPYMYAFKGDKCTLVVFRSGKCRVMGCKGPITTCDIESFPIKVLIKRIQSVTILFDMHRALQLTKLGNYCYKNSIAYMFEPELFPALRLYTFNPLCVNVFASGKSVILGVKHRRYRKLVTKVETLINNSNCYIIDDDYATTTQQQNIVREIDFTTDQCVKTKTQRL